MPSSKSVHKKKTPSRYSVVSLFSGCGGLDLGFKGNFSVLGKKYAAHDFKLEWANDFDAAACTSYAHNLQDPIVCGDITKILSGDYPDPSSPKLPKKADVVLGGFPCQDFSLSGKRKGLNGRRGILYLSMIEVVKKMRPAVFVAENVRGLMSMDQGRALQTIVDDFSKIGYSVSYQLFHVADFGVPQNRERIIIVGTDKRRKLPQFEFPKATHSASKRVTLSQAIGDLADLPEGSRPNHFWSKAKRFVGTQGNSITNPDKIAPTMRAEHHGNIEFHWKKKRRLSAREAARIQTFPDDFVFLPSTSSAYKQIGNAVPPVFGWHIASAVQSFLDNHLQK